MHLEPGTRALFRYCQVQCLLTGTSSAAATLHQLLTSPARLSPPPVQALHQLLDAEAKRWTCTLFACVNLPPEASGSSSDGHGAAARQLRSLAAAPAALVLLGDQELARLELDWQPAGSPADALVEAPEAARSLRVAVAAAALPSGSSVRRDDCLHC